MRAAFIVERAFYRKIQNLIKEKVIQPIFDAWLDMACASGVLGLPPVMGNYDYYKSCEFTGKSYEFSNPLAEAEAQALMIANRIMSRTQVCAENGTSYEKVIDDTVAEMDMEKAKGLHFGVMPKNTVLMAVPADLETIAPVAPAGGNAPGLAPPEEAPTPKPRSRKSRITKDEETDEN